MGKVALGEARTTSSDERVIIRSKQERIYPLLDPMYDPINGSDRKRVAKD